MDIRSDVTINSPKPRPLLNTPHSQLGEVMAANLQWRRTHATRSYTCYPASCCQRGRGLMGNHRGTYVANQPRSTRLCWGFLSSVAPFWSLWSSNGCFGGDLRGSRGNMVQLVQASSGFDRQSSLAWRISRSRSRLMGRVTANLYTGSWPHAFVRCFKEDGCFVCEVNAFWSMQTTKLVSGKINLHFPESKMNLCKN